MIVQEAVSDKKNEIPEVQELFRKLKIKGCLITVDALHCERRTTYTIHNIKWLYDKDMYES